ncbi:MAG: hypothetical protein MI757_15875, partial [Pirellulales bacterium]|nr:hypothetical protein [Pirellulales bacterium]
MRTVQWLSCVVIGIVLALSHTGLALAVEDGQHTSKPQPGPLFAPYVDMSLWPTFDLVAAAKARRIRHFTLAFVTSHRGEPCWGGHAAYVIGKRGELDKTVKEQIAAVRRLDADVTVSFGGATGTELAMAHKDVATLAKTYQRVIDAYELRRVDFDIEGSAIKD